MVEAVGCLLNGDSNLGQVLLALAAKESLHELAHSRPLVDPIEQWEDR